MTEIKHLSEASAATRARMDQATRESLLAIVVKQGKPLKIPQATLDEIWAGHRLIVEHDGENVILRAEKAELVVPPEEPKLIN